jgi:2-polyprenyl-3-methyl-5-hydroxy-6-metoxy-1,4-benzoquinol methylase
VIVCYEALEHVEDHEKLLLAKRLLVLDGLFIVSTRNKRITSLTSPNTGIPLTFMNLTFRSSGPF